METGLGRFITLKDNVVYNTTDGNTWNDIITSDEICIEEIKKHGLYYISKLLLAATVYCSEADKGNTPHIDTMYDNTETSLEEGDQETLEVIGGITAIVISSLIFSQNTPFKPMASDHIKEDPDMYVFGEAIGNKSIRVTYGDIPDITKNKEECQIYYIKGVRDSGIKFYAEINLYLTQIVISDYRGLELT